MKYTLIPAEKNNIELLINYKLETIFEYASNLDIEEIDKINNYVYKQVPKQLNNYKMIIVDDKIIGSVLLVIVDNKKILDEIYIIKEYRNKKIGTNIINEILKTNKPLHLMVYKNNIKAINLYKKIGFKIEDETETRYFMKI